MDDSHPFRFMSFGNPIPEIRLFQIQTLKLQGQSHGCGERAKSYNHPSIILIHFPFISHQSNQQFLRYIFFWNATFKHPMSRWWVRSKWMSHIIPSIQPMHFLFISHQSDQTFMRYGQNSVWTWKNTSEFLPKMKISQNNSFKQNF